MFLLYALSQNECNVELEKDMLRPLNNNPPLRSAEINKVELPLPKELGCEAGSLAVRALNSVLEPSGALSVHVDHRNHTLVLLGLGVSAKRARLLAVLSLKHLVELQQLGMHVAMHGKGQREIRSSGQQQQQGAGQQQQRGGDRGGRQQGQQQQAASASASSAPAPAADSEERKEQGQRRRSKGARCSQGKPVAQTGGQQPQQSQQQDGQQSQAKQQPQQAASTAALISHPSHCVRVRDWCSANHHVLSVTSFDDLCAELAARGVPCDSLYYEWCADRMRVADPASFEAYLLRMQSNIINQEEVQPLVMWETAQHRERPWKPTDEATHRADAHSAGVGSDFEPEPALSVTSESGSESDSGSCDTSQQDGFDNAVRVRDGWRCVVDATHPYPCLRATAVVPLHSRRSAPGRAAAGLFRLYDTVNGITLCFSCQDDFEAGLWGIEPAEDGLSRRIWAVALRLCKGDHRPTTDWNALHGKLVRVPTSDKGIVAWPSRDTFEVHWQFCAQMALKRAAIRREQPFACSKCGYRSEEQHDVALHEHYCTDMMPPNRVHTPPSSLRRLR